MARQRVRALREVSVVLNTSSWKVGDRVKLLPKYTDKPPYRAEGTIVKINRKTIGVKFDNGQQWRIPKGILERVE